MLNKLELTWIGKDENKINPEPRILIENKDYSYGEDSENMLIHGDNLLVLKALEQEYAGKIKCIYADVPYNTGSAFEHYDDNLEHSTWLSLMKPRLELSKNLLADNGSIWISIDDDEQAYLKVLCDEVFGRSNFINNVIWEKKYAPQNDAKWLSDSHDFIMIYAKNKSIWRPNLLPRTDEMDARYKNPDNDPRGVWQSDNLSVKSYSKTCDFTITTPFGREVNPPASACWRVTKEKYEEMLADNRIWFGADGKGVPRIKRFLTDVKQGITSMTIWKYSEVGHNQDARREVKEFNNLNVFATPKPEKLIERVLTLATTEGDIVLDSFLGSGTTCAVAHKMNRKYIGIELGDHAYTHCYPRLKAVVDGEQGGISKSNNFTGGGGFKFYELAPSLLEKDKFGNFIISNEYDEEMLAKAMAKHEGYKYEPDKELLWKQGFSGDTNFIFTTSGTLTPEYIEYLSRELSDGEYLLVCARSFDKACLNHSKNITVKQIPKTILGSCEFGNNSYDLNIELQNIEDDYNDEE